MPEPVIFSWSGGKDSALALHEIQNNSDYDIAALITTVSQEHDRVTIHGVRRALLDAQAAALNLPVQEITLPPECSNADYERIMRAALGPFTDKGITKVVHGDLFLEDLRQYREEKLAEVGMTGVFPIWKWDTTECIEKFEDLGFQAYIVCVDTQMLDGTFAGRLINRELLRDLPGGVDPCGENGEFHSFVFAGPIFARPIPVQLGERVLRDDRFQYVDLVPAE